MNEESRERERGNITRFSASDQIPHCNFIQLDPMKGMSRIWSGMWRRGKARFCRRNCRNEQKDGRRECNIAVSRPRLALAFHVLEKESVFHTSFADGGQFRLGGRASDRPTAEVLIT